MRPKNTSLGIAIALGLLGTHAGYVSAAALTVPTLDLPSNLFGAQPFKARVVLVEEFGSRPMPAPTDAQVDAVRGTVLGLPKSITTAAEGNLDDCHGTPSGSDLDKIIGMEALFPMPGNTGASIDDRDSNGDWLYHNPWESKVKDCLSNNDPNIMNVSMPMDGRPEGEDFKHQRWDEYKPKKFFQSIMAGARTSGGERDVLQSHNYGIDSSCQRDPATHLIPASCKSINDPLTGKWTEFGKGGLYYNTVTSPYAPGADSPSWAIPKDTQATVEGQYVKGFEGTTKGIPVNVDPLFINPTTKRGMPDQAPNSVWTFDGTIPLHLATARYGEPVLFRHYNALPITDDAQSNKKFGTHTITTHVHNFHMPAESDGFAGAWFYPGQFYDYRWPMALAGSDTINVNATDPRASAPCTPGETDPNGITCPDSGIYKVPGDFRETQSSLWFHDHMEDFTAQNVYKGNAAVFNIYSGIDRGNEEWHCRSTDAPTRDENNVNLCLPSGTSNSWGNRDYDVNLVIADKAFDQSGQLVFDKLSNGGFLGDKMTVNMVYKPFMDVRARKYRFRLLNGSVSRYIKVAVVDDRGVQVPFHMVANDGNILEHSVKFPNTAAGDGLPTQSIAERYDIVVDFAGKNVNNQPLIEPATSKTPAVYHKVYFVNLMEHTAVEGPKAPVTIANALNPAFDPGFNAKAKAAYKGNDFAIGKFMEFRIRPCQANTAIYDSSKSSNGGCRDNSMNPALYEEKVSVVDPVTKKTVQKDGRVMNPMPTFTLPELLTAKHRTFIYGRKPDTATDQSKPWTLATDGGEDLNADLARISAAPAKNSVEIWHLVSNSAGWGHPAHIHFEEGTIIKKDGLAPPAWEKFGRKDMYRLGPEFNSAQEIEIAIRVRDWTGTYVEHCHNTQHEDNAMLLRWDSEGTSDPLNPNSTHLKSVRTPHPDWGGVQYDIPNEDGTSGATYKLPTADTGSRDTTQAAKFVLPALFGQARANSGVAP